MLEVHREPARADMATYGWTYTSAWRAGRGDFVTPLVLPDARIAVRASAIALPMAGAADVKLKP
jgi:hypothetical protein